MISYRSYSNDEIDRIRRTDRNAGFEGVDYSIENPGADTLTGEHAKIPALPLQRKQRYSNLGLPL